MTTKESTMTDTMIDLPSVIAKSDDADFLRELIQDAAQRLMDIEIRGIGRRVRRRAWRAQPGPGESAQRLLAAAVGYQGRDDWVERLLPFALVARDVGGRGGALRLTGVVITVIWRRGKCARGRSRCSEASSTGVRYGSRPRAREGGGDQTRCATKSLAVAGARRAPRPSRVSKAEAVWRRRFQRNTNSSR